MISLFLMECFQRSYPLYSQVICFLSIVKIFASKHFLKNHIDVYVCIDMVCGDTKKVFESEDE